MSYDAIIIGAGHNGLVTAFYLGRAGLRVLVLEAREIVGGCCVTEELIPGYQFSTCANVLWALRPQIDADMRLSERGLTVDTRQFLRLLPDGRSMYTGRLTTTAPGESTDDVQREIAKFSQADAAAFPAWQAFQDRLTRIIGPFLLQPAPHLHDLYANCRNAADRETLDIVLTNSIAQIADRFFESDLMRDVGVAADIGDVHNIGTGLLFALTTAMGSYSETGQPVLNGFVRGGMGQLTALMADAAREQGVEIRTNTPISRILIEDGAARGVELQNGERIAATRVISNVDPKRTFLSLIEPNALDAGFATRLRRVQTHVAAGLKLHCALSETPQYRVNEPFTDQQLRAATVIIAPNRAYREAAWYAASQGRIPEAPIINAFAPSVYDESLAPPGHITWSTYITWVPAELREGSWETRREAVAEQLFDAIERWVPNFRRALLDYRLITPADLANERFLTDGNIHHVDAIPSQLFWQRPLPELAEYRTPVAGLYLCGAGTHPWGEVSGAPGYNAAHAILRELEAQA